MGFLKKIKRAAANIRSLIVAPISDGSSTFLNPNHINFGVTVNKDAAMRFTAVFAAVKLLAENIASLPKQVLRKTDNGSVEVFDHHVHYIICERPNGYTDDFSFWFATVVNLLLSGNAYIIMKLADDGRSVSLHLCPSGHVTVAIVKGEKTYVVSGLFGDLEFLNGVYLDYEVVHIMYFTIDSIHGIDPISYNAAAIGRGIATQKFSSEFYEKGGQIKGTLETDQNLGEDEFDNFMRHYQDSARNFETPILEYGIKYKAIGISPVAAQLIQSETMSIQDIARIYSVPPHLLAELSHATFSNIEQQNIHFGIFSLRPLCKRIEKALESKLFLEKERKEGYSIKFNLRGMMRGDDKARAEYYEKGISAGWMTPNEARAHESLSSLPGLDSPRIPLNTAYIDASGNIINPNNTNE